MAAATTMASAAGAVVLLYYVLSRSLLSVKGQDHRVDRDDELLKSSGSAAVKRRISRRPAQAPVTWFETMTTLSETLRFTYSETLGKWPIGDLAFGINYLLRRQGNQQVASVYAGDNCVQLKGPEMIVELNQYLRLLTLCMFFSKKPFPVFLDSSGYTEADVLLQKPKAGLLKPAFTILRDKNSKSFLLVIRGTHSIKDTLTAATGAVVPFHHSVLDDGGISNLVLGYAHCGMVAAARWIAKLSTPCLLKVLDEHPDYEVKIVGHSLGGGTAALLTYILREQKEFSSTTCVTFGPAACMTWDLAESGEHFISTIINGADLVPTFSTASLDVLRSEVTASSWLNELRDKVEHTRVLNVVYRSASALGSHLPSIASAKARVSGAGALLQPVSSSTQVVMKSAQNVAQAVVRTRSSLSSWSCIGARRRSAVPLSNSKEEDFQGAPIIMERTSESLVTEVLIRDPMVDKAEAYSSGHRVSGHDDTDEDDEHVSGDRTIATSTTEEMTEDELWFELEKELHGNDLGANIRAQEEAADEITEEEKVLVADAVESRTPISSPDVSDSQQFYPPGRILHMVSMALSGTPTDSGDYEPLQEHVGIYRTPRDLYSKLRLSRMMVNDHFMPMHKRMMERLVMELEIDEACS